MTNDLTDGKQRKSPGRKQKRDRQREAINKLTAAKVDVAPKLSVGGRPRILDPDQATLDRSIKQLVGLAMVGQVDGEIAASLGVSTDTLCAFLHRYPEVRDKMDDARAAGLGSIRTQLFKNMAGDADKKIAPNPQTAMWLGERLAGIKDPYKERELAQREEALRLRERDVVARERALDMKQPDGAGAPIDIKSLTLPQLLQLAQRIRELQAQQQPEQLAG